jgi:hypothetical protein
MPKRNLERKLIITREPHKIPLGRAFTAMAWGALTICLAWGAADVHALPGPAGSLGILLIFCLGGAVGGALTDQATCVRWKTGPEDHCHINCHRVADHFFL